MIKRVLERATVIVGVQPVNMFAMNQYCVICPKSKSAAIIDPGDDRPQNWASFAEKSQAKISSIMVTHAHVDHVQGLKQTQATFKEAKTYMHRDDEYWLTNSRSLTGMFGIPPMPVPNPPDVYVKDGDKIKVGELTFEVIHTPGHSPGHVVFYEPKEQLLFSGDLLFNMGIGRTDFPMCDERAMYRSLKKLFDKVQTDAKVFPGHNESTSMEYERRSNPFLRMAFGNSRL